MSQIYALPFQLIYKHIILTLQTLQNMSKIQLLPLGHFQPLVKTFHGQLPIRVYGTTIQQTKNTFHQLLAHSKPIRKYGSKVQHSLFFHGQTVPLPISRITNSKFTVLQEQLSLKLQQQQWPVHLTKLQNRKALKYRFHPTLTWLSFMVNLTLQLHYSKAKKLITQQKHPQTLLSQLQSLKRQATLLSRVVMFTRTILKTKQEQLTNTTALTTLTDQIWLFISTRLWQLTRKLVYRDLFSLIPTPIPNLSSCTGKTYLPMAAFWSHKKLKNCRTKYSNSNSIRKEPS